MPTRNALIVSWILQLVVAGILFQTLFFKFTGAEESVYIFSTLGVEPWGRIAAGLAELAVVALILYPPTAAVGAVAALGVMSGALLSHAQLGLIVQDDGGLLFGLAVAVFVASAAIVVIRRAELAMLSGRIARSLTVS